MTDQRKIAYFTMEIALEANMPTYSGGLGVLAGDTVRSAAELEVPMVVVTLLHRKGYFHQRLDAEGTQTEGPVEWKVEDFLEELPARVSVTLERREVRLRAWRYEVRAIEGFKIPVYFLDSDLPENAEPDRTFTHFLYGGDQRYRLCQEVILGMGGVRILRSLGYSDLTRFHMNEGHSSLLILELLCEELRKTGRRTITHEDIGAVRQKCVFTTHTPVASGHDQFPMDMVLQVVGEADLFREMKNMMFCGDLLHLTFLALNLSHYVNGVAKKHREIARLMFAGYQIDSITNGVDAATWVGTPLQQLFDEYIHGWRRDNFSLRYAGSIPKAKIWQAHQAAKKQLIRYVNDIAGVGLVETVFTIGFGRRVATYKRADLLFSDLDRLRSIAVQNGPLQIIYAGKAHPRDYEAKELLKRVYRAKEALKKDIAVVYLPNYDMESGKMMVSGVDLWLNTPQPPLEASGTSGMKAALNGVPSLSVLDGWWIEGHFEGVTGWAIGGDPEEGGGKEDWNSHALSLYQKLEQIIAPMFYGDRDRFIQIMRDSISINGSFFNSQRMVREYLSQAYT